MVSLSRYPDATVPAPMLANTTAVLRPDIARVKEFAMFYWTKVVAWKEVRGQRCVIHIQEVITLNINQGQGKFELL